MSVIEKTDFKPVSKNEAQKLLINLLAGRSELNLDYDESEGCEPHEIEAVVEWANEVKASAALLDAVLAGKLVVDVDEDNEVTFREPEYAEGVGNLMNMVHNRINLN